MSEKEIEELELVISNFSFSENTETKQVAAVVLPPVGFREVEIESPLSPEIVELIEQLASDARAIDIKKNKLANSLYDIPDNVNAKALVKEIKTLREKWRVKMDEVKHVKKFGKLPELPQTDSEFEKNLPTSLLELDRRLRYRKSDLSNYKKRLMLAKSEDAKAKQERNIMTAKYEIEIIESRIKQLTA